MSKLSKMKKGELLTLANEHNIPVLADATKKDLIAALGDLDFDESEETEESKTAELSDYAKNAEFREWWSKASKADRNAYLADRDPDSIAAPHDKCAEKPRTKIKR